MIDLHVHTTCSDGTDSPAVIVQKAQKIGLSAVAITDHDTTVGVNEAEIEGKRLGIEVIPGIEISATYKAGEVHLLGYFIDTESCEMKKVLNFVINDRNSRNERMVNMLQKDGFPISMSALNKRYPGVVLGRPHIAEYLMEKGIVSSIQQAFNEFLASGKSYFLARTFLPFDETVKIIKDSGGIAVIAHPLQYKFSEEQLEAFIQSAKKVGVLGMEAFYSKYSCDQSSHLSSLAEKYDMLLTGGTDYHGTHKPGIALGFGMGKLCVPDELLLNLKNARR